MPIDARIALGVQGPQLESPINAMQNAMQIGAYQNKLAAAQQEQQRQRSLQNFLSSADLSNPATRAKLNQFDTSGETFKNLESGYSSRATGAKAEFESALAMYNDFRRGLGGLAASNADRDTVVATINDYESRGILKPELAAHYRDTLPTDPAQLQTRLKRGAMELASPDQIMAMFNPKLEMADLGATKQPYNPYTGKPVGTGMAVSLSPDEQSRQNREYNPGKVAHVTTDDQGNVRFFNAQGGEVNPGAGKGAGKPAGAVITARQKAEQLRKDLQSTVGELQRIVKPGGLLDVSTGSGAGALVDRAAEFVGSTTEGAQAISKLKPIADMVLKLVPRFEGPQSDADTKSYRDAAGDLANPSLPREQRKAAAQTILRLFKQRQGQFGTPDAEGNIVTSGAAPSTAGGSDIDAIVDKHRTK